MTTERPSRPAIGRPGRVSAVDAVLIVLIVFTAVSSVLTQPFWGLSLESAPAEATSTTVAPTVTIDGEPISVEALPERLRHAEGTFLVTVTPARRAASE
jgi:hypothetical protein